MKDSRTFRIAFLFFLPVACIGFVQCARMGALMISEREEARLGAEFDALLRTDPRARQEYPMFVANTAARQAFHDYVIGLAQSVYAAIPANQKPEYPFRFSIIDNDVRNAFAVPGGYVYIHTGLIKAMRDESELVGVLSHEIAHVTQHHYREAMAKQVGLALLLQALVGNDAGQIRQLVAQSFGTLATLAVSRGNERDADYYGTLYTGMAGRNPLGIAKFFHRIPNPGPQWLSTHPAPANRVENVVEQVLKHPQLNQLAADSVRTNYRSRFEQMTAVIR